MNKIIYAMAAAMIICLSVTVFSSAAEEYKQNDVWWCVMNPPIYFTENLDADTYDTVNEKPQIGFKIVEIINGIGKRAKEKR